MRVIAHQGETLDAVCWRVLQCTAGVTEAALAANPGLADDGPILPQGRRIDLPDRPTVPRIQPIQLWD